MAKKEKTIELYKTSALGFPIIIRNVKMKFVAGEWCPVIKWNRLMKCAIFVLITKPSALTGGEVKFIRTYFDYSFREFASQLGVTAAAVKKWESKNNQKTNMSLPTERNIRLLILINLFPKATTRSKKEFIEKVNFIIESHFNEARKPFEFESDQFAA